MGGHSRIPASASSRWLICTASIDLELLLIKQKMIEKSSSSPAAELGTAVHYIIEQILLKKGTYKDFIGEEIQEDGMENPVLIGPHEIACAKVCVDYVKKERKKAKKNGSKVKMLPERKYDLTKVYKAPLGGTADVTIVEFQGTLHIIDYKNGRIHVGIKNNTQLRVYALGAYYAFNGKYSFNKIKLTIVQPNDSQDDEPIRSETFDVEKLLKWEKKKLRPALKAIVNKKGKLVPDADNQCYWCRCKPHCIAYQENKPKMLSDVMKDVICTTDINTLPEPHSLSEEQLRSVLHDSALVIKFYMDCKEEAIKRIEKDRSAISGYNIYPKQGNRSFIKQDELLKKLKKKKIKLTNITKHTEDRLMTVTELQAYLIGKKKMSKEDAANLMDEITERKQTGFMLQEVDTAEDEFAEFATPENKKSKKSKTSKKSKKSRK